MRPLFFCFFLCHGRIISRTVQCIQCPVLTGHVQCSALETLLPTTWRAVHSDWRTANSAAERSPRSWWRQEESYSFSNFVMFFFPNLVISGVCMHASVWTHKNGSNSLVGFLSVFVCWCVMNRYSGWCAGHTFSCWCCQKSFLVKHFDLTRNKPAAPNRPAEWKCLCYPPCYTDIP